MSECALRKAPLHERAFSEFKEIAALAAYLYVCLGAIILFKAAVLQGVGVNFTIWGIAIVKALILAKFMLVGRMVNLGERYRDKPLIWPALHRSLMFLLLLLVLTTIEELVVGLISWKVMGRLAWPCSRPHFSSGASHQLHHVPGSGPIFRIHLPWRRAWRARGVSAVFCR